MAKILSSLQRHFHPLHVARKTPAGRILLRAIDRPVWISLPSVKFKVRGKRLTHGASFGMAGPGDLPMARACFELFKFESFWDIGANFGYYSWLIKSLSPETKIVLVEPLPSNASLIQETIARNQFSAVHLINAGASDTGRQGLLHADTFNGLTSSLCDGATFEQRHYGVKPKEIPVALVTLDSMRGIYGSPSFVKIDVEGHEGEVLRGAQDVLSNDQPLILIECSHPGRPCLKSLESIGYQCIDADTLNVDRAERSINFLCVPPYKQGAIEDMISIARMIA